MGQISSPITGQIIVNTIDRESGPGAGGGATGNRALFLGLSAGQNSTASDFIALGNLAASGGITSVNGMNGTTVIGSGSVLGPLESVGASGPGQSSGIVALGSNILATAQTGFGDSVYIGNNILASIVKTSNAASTYRNVIIGNNAVTGTASGVNPTFDRNVVIGYGALAMPGTGGTPLTQCIVIGDGALSSSVAQFISDSIIIGRASGPGTTTASLGTSTIVGSQSRVTIAGGSGNAICMFGRGNTTSNGADEVIIGTGNILATGNNGAIIIGTAHGVSVTTPAANGTLLIGSDTYGLLIHGVQTSGNLSFGNETTGANRKWRGTPGTNNVKIINGTAGSGAEVPSGGYFYATAGVLNWRDQNGIETTLSRTTAGQLASTNAAAGAYTNNAGAAAGTLNNAPAAGNPTKWIPINDNGTIRNIPAW